MDDRSQALLQQAQAKGQGQLPAYMTRRTFAIISHPDAGKTTLTEKLLHASGAVQLAGEVKARGDRRRTRSDWMQIEQQRGISVTSSVMTFEYQGLTFNLLDTPGHADFSEDTYRTLTAVDAAIMVIDAAKGIEQQTLKLFEICRLRNIPILTFVNKVDREGRDPLEILDEIAETLALDVSPASWPVGMGVDFKGILDLGTSKMTSPGGSQDGVTVPGPNDPARLDAPFDIPEYQTAFEGLELAEAMLPPFDLDAFLEGHLTPVFFGSALKSVGVTDLLNAIAKWAPWPGEQPAEPEPIKPGSDEVTGFVFKVQANMDPKHRDRIAFVRLCSGTFRRGMKLTNVKRQKDITVSAPMLFFARERETADTAVPGDIVGIPNHGTLSVGDTLTEGSKMQVTGIPDFAPEIIQRVRLSDPIKSKQLAKALGDLSEEGVTQVFRPMLGADWIVGVVGALQLDVLSSRVEKEYGVPIRFESFGCNAARWISGPSDKVKEFTTRNRAELAEDGAGMLVYLAKDMWWLQRAEKDWPDLKFLATRERT